MRHSEQPGSLVVALVADAESGPRRPRPLRRRDSVRAVARGSLLTARSTDGPATGPSDELIRSGTVTDSGRATINAHVVTLTGSSGRRQQTLQITLGELGG